jgi:spore coat protein CotH
MQSSRKFALIANTSDPSFLRNKITFDLAALSRMPASPQAAFVHVYFNGRYHGLYLMAQRPNGTYNGLFHEDGSVYSLEDYQAIAGKDKVRPVKATMPDWYLKSLEEYRK